MKHHHKWTIALAFVVAVGIILYATRLGNDDEITQRVVEALQSHPVVNANDLGISFAGGVVTMTGNFPDQETRRMALEEVKKIRGVERVVDRTVIEGEGEEPPSVSPAEPTDPAAQDDDR